MARHSYVFSEPKDSTVRKGQIVYRMIKGVPTKKGRAAFEVQRDALAGLVRLPREKVSDADVIEWLAREKKVPDAALAKGFTREKPTTPRKR